MLRVNSWPILKLFFVLSYLGVIIKMAHEKRHVPRAEAHMNKDRKLSSQKDRINRDLLLDSCLSFRSRPPPVPSQHLPSQKLGPRIPPLFSQWFFGSCQPFQPQRLAGHFGAETALGPHSQAKQGTPGTVSAFQRRRKR